MNAEVGHTTSNAYQSLHVLVLMRTAQCVISLALTIALAAYGLQCLVRATPEQAMQCCNAMHCHSHHHHSDGSQDCCKTMPQMHIPLGQPSSFQGIVFAPVALGMVRVICSHQIVEFSIPSVMGHSHDPPLSWSKPTRSLRI